MSNPILSRAKGLVHDSFFKLDDALWGVKVFDSRRHALSTLFDLNKLFKDSGFLDEVDMDMAVGQARDFISIVNEACPTENTNKFVSLTMWNATDSEITPADLVKKFKDELPEYLRDLQGYVSHAFIELHSGQIVSIAVFTDTESAKRAVDVTKSFVNNDDELFERVESQFQGSGPFKKDEINCENFRSGDDREEFSRF